jgi:hypothetical protein
MSDPTLILIPVPIILPGPRTWEEIRLRALEYTFVGLIAFIIIKQLHSGLSRRCCGYETSARATVGYLAAAINLNQNKHNGRLPTSLKSMVGREISSDLLLDPWGNEFLYEKPAKRSKDAFDVYSAGMDITAGTLDDIGNFEMPELGIPPPTLVERFKSWIW